MKKVLTITLALVLVFAFSASALAVDKADDCLSEDRANRQMEMKNDKGLGGGSLAHENMRSEDRMQVGMRGIEGENAEQREQDREEMLADLPEAVATQLEDGREEIMTQRDENRDLQRSIREIVRDIRENGGEIDQEIIDDLHAYHDQIRDIHDTMRDNQGAIHEIIEDLDNMSEADAIAAIAEIQELRLEMMQEINVVLQDMQEYVSDL